MSLNPRRNAGVLRKHFCRIVALVCLSALITPSAALIVTRTAQARAASTTPAAPISEPPPPFHVGTETPSSPMLAFNASVVSGVASLFAVKPLPPEFATGHLPTFSDKVISVYGSALGLVVPSLVTKKAPAPPTPSTGPVNFDFDNDGKADFGRWHSSTNELKVIGSTAGTLTFSVGTSSYIAAPGDFDGDGKTDAAVFNGTTWKYKTSTGGTEQSVTFGSAGDIPVPGNYVGSSRTDMAVYRPSTGVWYMKEAVSGTVTSSAWGNSGDQPVPGDYDADGVMDFAVFRPSNGTWYINGSTMGVYIAAWGATGDVPVPADYDGDGKTDLAVYRPTTGTWYVLKSSDSSVLTPGWGNYGDQPAPADYDGDGKADFCVWRPKTGTWYVMHASDYSYEYASIGVAGDTAVSSAYIQQIGASVSPDLLAAARLSPKNATGGTNLYSQNFSWGTQLVGLPGRSGLDMGFGISYNSLVWTKVGSSIVFDADTSNVSPGFRFGFPTIEPNYYDDKTGKFSYLMVTPSGGRVEFRQTAASDTYETADSNYAQLVASESLNPNDPTDGVKLIVKTTDGTQMTYEWKGGAFRCNQIKDRNGNYITIANSDEGLLQTVTDTLGRVITVNYDSSLYPTSITQTWKGTNGSGSNTTHTWATFTYTTTSGTGDYPAIATSFDSGLTVFGPANGTTMKVLQKITYPDGSSTKFYYNGYAQVDKIENYSAETTPTLLNYVSNNLNSVSSGQTDCPKLTDTYNWVKNFNVVSGSEVATHTTNSVTTGQTYSLPGSISGTATKIEVSMASDSYNSVTKAFVGSSGWNEGLPIATEDWADGSSGSERKRWTYTGWTQDDTVATYPVNPRVEETRVGDSTNIKKTTLKYTGVTSLHPASTFGLVEEAKVYAGDLSTVIKKVVTTYNDSSNYVSRRIIGLPSEVVAYGKNDVTTALDEVSDTTYVYDYSGYAGTGQSLSTPTQRDDTNYGTSFSYRGNLTSTTRHDPGSVLADTITSAVYNIAGSPISQTSPWDGTNTRTIRIGYTDVWNDGTTRYTYAYPTTITDPAGSSLGDSAHSSTVKYRFDTGANVEANSPAPTGQTYGKRSLRLYDSIGRLDRNSIYINTTEHSYVRYEYPTNGVESLIYAPRVDQDGDGNIAEDEVTTESWSDGAGRTLRIRTENPNSTGGWTGVLTEYNILGQTKRTSVPTEISVSGTTWTPAGDDYTRGWIWNSQEYDWKGRTTRTIPSDSTGSDGKDTLISYGGCGCAGGQITTVKGPITPAVDVAYNLQTTKRRTQKSYEDILGRTYQTEIWDLDGAGSAPYSTVFQKFNGRDQVLESTQYAGGTSSSTHQSTTATYDGFGRLASSHRPEQRDTSNNLKYTTYNYNPDDSISGVTDGRGAVTNFTYNVNKLLTQKAWTVPSALLTAYPSVADPTDVTFSYDNLGNRTQMTDGLGTVTYTYDGLSEMTSESRQYSDTDTGFPSNTVTLNYTYTISGKLKTYTAPYHIDTTPYFTDLLVSYDFDKTGRLVSVGQSSASGSLTIASNPHYRAWGALSHLEYGNGTEMNSGGFNNALQATTFNVKKGTTNIINKGYEFDNDGSVKKETDAVDARFDRSFKYDFRSAISQALTGAEARGSTDSWSNIPYHSEYGYDAFGHRTFLGETSFYAYPTSGGTPASGGGTGYTNNWMDNPTGDYNHYDQDGNQWSVIGDARIFYYNAAGQMSHTLLNPAPWQYTEDITYDGDGNDGKVATAAWDDDNPPAPDTTYRIRSTPLGGQVVYEGTGVYVYAGGTRIAVALSGSSAYLQHIDPNGHTLRTTGGDGTVYGDGEYGNDLDKKEFDPDGKNIGFHFPNTYDPPPGEELFAAMSNFSEAASGRYNTYKLDGINVPADFFWMRAGADHSSFGLDLLEFNSVMSQREVGRWYRNYDGKSQPSNDEVIRVSTDNKLLRIVYDTSWSAINLISSQTQQKDLFFQKRRVRRLSEFEVLALRNNVSKNLSQDCENFIRDLITQVGKDTGLKPFTTDVLGLFDAVAGSSADNPDGNPGGFLGFVEPQGGASGVSAWPSSGSLALPVSRYAWDGLTSSQYQNLSPGEKSSRLANSFGKFSSNQVDAFIVVHELIHIAFLRHGASDQALALAATEILKEKPPDYSNLGKEDPTNYASRVWDNRLRGKCGMPLYYSPG